MRTVLNKWNKYWVAGIAYIFVFMFLMSMNVYADGKTNNPQVILYENADGFSMAVGSKVDSPSYGKNIGTMFITGADGHTTVNGTAAYAADGKVVFGYSYNSGDYLTDKKENWNLVNSDAKAVGDIKLSKKIGNGTVLIQKSSNGTNWVDACDPIYNFFTDKKLDRKNLYTVVESDIKEGKYFRVLVFYEMKKKTGVEKGLFGIKNDVFKHKYCVEKYDFYISYASNPVSILNLKDRSVLSNNAVVTDGFTLDDNDASARITVKKDNGQAKKAKAFDSFYEPGSYTIDVTSPMGDKFQNKVKISDGLATISPSVKKHINKEKTGYVAKDGDGGDSTIKTLTSLMISQKSGTKIKQAVVGGYAGFGITGESVGLYINVTDPEVYNKSGWEVVSDEWGKKEKQTIDGVWAGQVGSGALIIQKSKNGKSWTQVDKGKYANGIYTTDFYKNYGGNGDILIYTPDGTEVLNGVYLRVLYAYEIKQSKGKEKRKCIEEYSFYLCSDELGAITFHNLTADGQIEEICGDEDEITLKMYESAETMDSGAVTVSGFTVDTSLNPTATYTIKKDGKSEYPGDNRKYTETGRYDIQLKSAVGSTKDVTLYVDRMDTEETLKKYFGNGFIDGKRIYDETSQYPVFEGGKTKYTILSVANSYQPLYGTLKNITTGKSEDIASSPIYRTVNLSDPGEYEVVLNNNPTYKTNNPSGDNKQITFHFKLIAEGTAPGPQVNKRSLIDSINDSVVGAYPKYYGLTYSSAAGGNITLAFSTREAAFKYAYEYEKGTVEQNSDGSYRYTGSFNVKQKDKYDSAWDLTDAINYFAEQAIQELYFDVSDESKYMTLSDSTLEKVSNPRTIELNNSVVIFADGQEELLTNLEALPIINSLPYAYQEPGKNTKPKLGKQAFAFVKDKYGCDSNKVTISGVDGKQITVVYGKDVENQLKSAGFSTGTVKITEETVYGDSNTYDAVYFADGENTARIKISCEGDKNKIIELSQADNGKTIEAEAFSIKSITDQLDPYSIAIVEDVNGKTTAYCTAEDKFNGMWADAGLYDISVVNRIGNKYSFKVNIAEAKYATITFEGEGTESFQPILVKTGDKDVHLEVPVRYGYDFAGYDDEDGMVFENVIDKVSFSGSKVLSPRWRAKKICITLKDINGETIDTLETSFGVETELPVPMVPEGYSFVGWMKEDNLLKDNKIKLTEEGDITLVALFSENQKPSDEQQVKNENTKSKRPVVPIISVVIILGIAGIAVKNREKIKTLVGKNNLGKDDDSNQVGKDERK